MGHSGRVGTGDRLTGSLMLIENLFPNEEASGRTNARFHGTWMRFLCSESFDVISADIMTMRPFLLPSIAPDDYHAFSRLNDSDLPETYDEWLKVQAKMRDQGSQAGYILEQRQVDPREFVRYCSPRALAPNMNSLLMFVQEKAAGRRY
jgi:hypothetical protein